ncbi:MAG: uracil-DNA glycosylase [Leuconostoc mesenteroides]|jgi:uracil-DNA glycosylase|uniref:Uracil-DNA glycosylase n=2 Tax=Leuconostoc mesenteroides TaxID=1245 RepID=UNG_LEUMM|nr:MULTISPECIES: uracil-DNA glycosylase [Leuconostoc]Q03W63.1 RecName: Full=Uracil-DNA glycosylase; Short=UDG [Leuconostoc mesenteroides subsp. mesenteroides ATCC 8293]ABJ62559.1 Uracil-DNA glycosylase [Leuconostoc mesenteroides subsp. mesenteroides ATCC 8293]AET30744.1 uracil-DNA glycosylase [Leuconostoc mesenteroides subsp. mesenteroides J18]AHF19461.1 Uracil DNA glycosylase [Leuconostoc mesenteroides KFRI-MG]APE77023.1 uracil-DNA glycosylase [Leuconostoc mesenteroides subsp. jonggajibkimchi
MPLSHTTWAPAVKAKLNPEYLKQVAQFIQSTYREDAHIFPQQKNIFAALEKTPLPETKVVIMGQDPYHNIGQAQGLSFSVPENVPAPPSLQNILKELSTDVGPRQSHDLTSWSTQGVLLLNAVLTVPEGQANAHQGKIWEPLTDSLIQIASEDDAPKVFILWGKFAQSKRQFIDESKHLVLMSAHPSPLSAYRGFFGSQPFSKANHFLVAKGRQPIDWLK